jgi:lipoate---protein ligase
MIMNPGEEPFKKDDRIQMNSMQSHSVYKVPQGKLLKISLEYDEKKKVITAIRITGDFFAYPEEAIEHLENELKDTILERKQLLEQISSIVSEYHIEFIGINAEGLTHGILMCVP